MMPLRRRRKTEVSDPSVIDARHQVDLEIEKFLDVLDQVQYRADRLKEELRRERGAG